MKGIFFLYLLITFFISGCGIRERERVVQQKEAELTQKEQELLLKEKTLQLKEEELLVKQQQLDSTKQQQPDSTNIDTTFIYNHDIVGNWSVNMTGIETTCPGSAVGDTKSETWEFSYQNNSIIAKAMSDGKLVRVYTGAYKNNLLELTEDVEHSPTSSETKMLVRLTLLNEKSMEGQREIIRPDCKIVYSLQLNKQ